ncbi:hypothetical protein CgunFtcFv8_026594 [Champsocephalus gunnari]|uniref:Uncharacterized protein n=1 Tax=Champsocephalus gunnari TaxID=52237 RepID=A0AAN8DW22_CHAGU|nr:hypothetical protein CgunFtcFv8_026594 [Champsocephalus gunnari]
MLLLSSVPPCCSALRGIRKQNSREVHSHGTPRSLSTPIPSPPLASAPPPPGFLLTQQALSSLKPVFQEEPVHQHTTPVKQGRKEGLRTVGTDRSVKLSMATLNPSHSGEGGCT